MLGFRALCDNYEDNVLMIAKNGCAARFVLNKIRDKIWEDTVLVNYPLYCPKCMQETLIGAKNLKITVIKELDAKMQSR